MDTLNSFADLLQSDKRVFEIAQNDEADFCECSVAEIRNKTGKIIDAMHSAIEKGMKSHEMSASKMVGCDCHKLKNNTAHTTSMFSSAYKNTMLYALATAEENARMGKIAACPTAGACGIVPAVLFSIAELHHLDKERLIDGLLTAGVIGKIVAAKMALAGAVAGCQSECGVAAAMAAGAAVEMLGGTTQQIINAAALALKNIMGLVCDPIAGLVEVPCVKRNAFLAVHAITSAEMALADIESVVPADEVVDATKQVGALMSPMLKESSQAGLATTPTGLSITEKLNKVWGI